MADENKKQTALLENINAELKQMNSSSGLPAVVEDWSTSLNTSLQAGFEPIGKNLKDTKRLVGGVPFGSAQFTDDIEGLGQIFSQGLEVATQQITLSLDSGFKADEENESKETEDKKDRNSIFKKMLGGLSSIGASLKDKAMNITKSMFGKIPMGTILGLGIMALISFLNSDQWRMIATWVDDALTLIEKLWKNVLKPLLVKIGDFLVDSMNFVTDPSWETARCLLENHSGTLLLLSSYLALKFGPAIMAMYKGIKSIGIWIAENVSKKSVAAALTKMKPFIGPLALIGGLVMAIYDGVMGYFKSDDWGASKISSVMGAMFGGTGKGGIQGNLGSLAGNAAKWAAIGFGAFSIFGPFAVLGGILGAIFGTILGYFGGEKIAKGIDAAAEWVAGEWKAMISSIREWVSRAIMTVKRALGLATDAEKRKLIEESMKDTDEDIKKAEARAAVIKKRMEEIEAKLASNTENMGAYGDSDGDEEDTVGGGKGRSYLERSNLKTNALAGAQKLADQRIAQLQEERDALRKLYEGLKKGGTDGLISNPSEGFKSGGMMLPGGMTMGGGTTSNTIVDAPTSVQTSNFSLFHENINDPLAAQNRFYPVPNG